MKNYKDRKSPRLELQPKSADQRSIIADLRKKAKMKPPMTYKDIYKKKFGKDPKLPPITRGFGDG